MTMFTVRARLCVFPLLVLSAASRAVLAQGHPDSSSIRPRVTALPVIGSAPETGLQYGATALRIFRTAADTATRTSQLQVYGIHTANSQARGFLQLDRWSPGNRWRVRARGEYQHFPLPFFGIGDNTPDEAEERYTSTGPTLELLLQRRIAGAVYVGGATRVMGRAVREVEPGKALASGSVFGRDGGTVVQLQGFMAHDTRDHVLSARAGHLMQLTVSASGGAIGSRYDFTRYALDTRRYWSFGERGHVVAGQLLAEATTGRAPFDQLVQVGSDTAMRGYTRGRYRDVDGLNAQLEYRSPTWRRVGVTAFGGGGLLAPRLGALADARFLPSVGAGVRVLLVPAQRASIRIDYGKGKGSSGLYIALNEAF